jgi:hypothetical protein
MSAFREASDAHGLSASPDLNFAFRMPGVLAEAGETEAACRYRSHSARRIE